MARTPAVLTKLALLPTGRARPLLHARRTGPWARGKAGPQHAANLGGMSMGGPLDGRMPMTGGMPMGPAGSDPDYPCSPRVSLHRGRPPSALSRPMIWIAQPRPRPQRPCSSGRSSRGSARSGGAGSRRPARSRPRTRREPLRCPPRRGVNRARRARAAARYPRIAPAGGGPGPEIAAVGGGPGPGCRPWATPALDCYGSSSPRVGVGRHGKLTRMPSWTYGSVLSVA